MSRVTKGFFTVVNTHTHTRSILCFKETVVQRVFRAIFNINVWKENDVTCWGKCPNIPTDDS